MKYYTPEHEQGYERIRASGLNSWDQLHGRTKFEDAEIREVLCEALPHAHFNGPRRRALEYGCGTGAGSCLLAEKGMIVTGIDLSSIAIDIARQEAAQRRLSIEYFVADMLDSPRLPDKYDLIVDSYCLQCIVTDADRRKLFDVVRVSLDPRGWYLIASAGFSDSREYRDSLFNSATGIEMEPLSEPHEKYEDAIRVDDRWYLPSRRHITLDMLSDELARSGFSMHWGRTDSDGDLAALARIA